MDCNTYGPDIKKVQRRIANTSIGVSTLRNQGPKGIIAQTRKFLSKLDLSNLPLSHSNDYQKWLDNETKNLMRLYMKKLSCKNWGAARKSLNIFMENAFYDKYMSRKYNLIRLEYFLELPVDNQFRKGIERDLKTEKIDHDLPSWRGIIRLEAEDNEKWQSGANKLAIRFNIPRIFLDLNYWRPEESDNKRT